MKTDILAIGDLAEDVFINIHEDNKHCTVDMENEKLILDFGGKIPYDSVTVTPAVGNSGNAAVCAGRLGLSSAILSRIGNDKEGQECILELQKNNVDTSLLKIEDGKRTNCHFVLWYDVDRTILVKHESFNYSLENIEPPKWLYLTSLGPDSLPFHNQIVEWLEKTPQTKLAFQPGTYQIRFGAKQLSSIYKLTKIFFCNTEEAREILQTDEKDVGNLLEKIAGLGPKIVCITDGINGAYIYDTYKSEKWFLLCYPGQPAFERTGAGDAFASTIVAALAKGLDIKNALLWGPINAMSVTLFIGAQKGLLSEEQIQEYLTKASESYRLQRI